MRLCKQALVPLLVLVLALGCLAGLTLATSADDTSEYNLWVGTTPVNSTNKDDVLGNGTVSYDPSTHTLTLDNASITQWRRMSAYTIGTEANIYFGDSGNALTIVLIGDNSINATMNGTAAAYGIKTNGDLHIQGAGTLTFSGDPQIAINAGTYSALYFDDANNCPTVNIPNCTRYGLYARNITVYSAHIDVSCDCTKSDTQHSHQYECTAAGIYAERTLTIGRENTQETTYVHAQVPEVSNSTPYHALYGGSSITLPYSRAIVRPSSGSLGTYYNYSYYGQIVKDSESNQAFDVLIKTFALPANYEEYPLWVNAIRVDSLNADDVLEDGTVSYDAEHHILTLNGATVTHAYSWAGIRYEGTDALTIVAEGNNTIAAANQAYGIFSFSADLSFRGDGTINISNADTWGVFTNNDLRFDEPNASDADCHPTLNITAYRGISAYNITLYRAVLNITATASTQPTEVKGIDAGGYLKIGEGSRELQTNDVSITLHCEDGCKAIEASYGTITISNPDAIVTPAGGSISADGHTIEDGEGTTASDVVILVEPYIVKYGLWVDGVQVTENNAGSLSSGGSFDPVTNTLTLDGSLRDGITMNGKTAAICSTLPELNIVLQSSFSVYSYNGVDTAILVPENSTLNISGSGTISLSSIANGIVAGAGSTINLNAGDLDLRGSTIGIDAAGSTVNLSGSTLRLSGEPYGMDVGSFTMTGGTLTANMITNNNTAVAAIRAGSFTMSGGTLTANVEGASAEKAIYATGSFTMTGGTLNASVSGDSAVTAIYAANGIQISDSLQITAPERCLPWGGTVNTHLRDVTGAAAVTVQIQPPDAGSATTYDFWVGPTQITDKNRNNPLGDGTATYDDSTHTLYLDNAQLRRYENNHYGSSHIFYMEADALTVCLFGESSYTTSPTNTDPGTANRGIYVYNADLRIIGNGKLTMYGYFAGIECGLDHSVTFGDETTCPTLVISGSQFGVHASNIYIDRANLDVTCSGVFQSSGNSYCENAALCAESSGWYGNIRIGAENGEGGVTLHATVGRQADKCYAIYAKHELRIMDNEGIVTPNGGGILNSTGVHTVVEGQKNTSAYEVRIAPQTPPAAVENGYQLWLNGVQVCQANKDDLPGLPAGCRFDPNTNTLYLTGEAVFDRPMLIDNKGCAIYSKLADLTIELAEGAEADLSGHSYGVYAGRNCNVHIRGSGRMDIHDTAYGIVCNDRGRLYFDGTDAGQRPVLRIEATNNGLLSNFIYLWNCNVTASGQTAIKATTYYTVPYNQAVYDGGVIEIGTQSTDTADAWKNNAAVYATGTYAFFAERVLYGDQIVAGSLTLSGEEMVLLPNNAEIVSYNKNIGGFRFRDSITKEDVRTVYVIPRGEEPDHATPYELWINGLQVYAANAYDLPGLPGSWFDGPSRTLYLNGYVTLDGVSAGKDAPIYTTLADLTIVLDYGRATLCAEQHNYGIYSTQNLHIRGGGEMVIASAALEAIHVGGTLSFDDVDFAPLVSAYSYQYGIRAGSIVLRQANLNAIVFNTDRTQGDHSTVKNAAILANSITIGANSDEVCQNNVTLYASCDDTEGFQGYALYADSTLSHPSSYIDILEPTTDAAWGTHTITRAGSKAGTVRLGINQKAYYVNILEDYEDPSDAPDLPAVTLNGHEDFRAFPGKTVSFTVTPPKNYNFDTLRVYYFDENDIEQEVTVTNNTFTMPEADVYLDASFLHRNYQVTVVDPEGGTVEASCEYANSNERVDVTFDEDVGYLWRTLAITTDGGETVNYQIAGGAMGSGQGHFHVYFYMPSDDVTVSVTFAKALYNIYTPYSANGSVTPSSDSASYGDLVTLTPAPDPGYRLDTLTVTGTKSNQTVSVNSNYQFVMPAEDVRVTATFTKVPIFVGHSLSLKGDIGVNFYVDPNGVAAENLSVSFTWGAGNETTVHLSELTAIAEGQENAGCYKLTANVAAKEMNDTVTATVCYGSTAIASNEYSVKQYCDTILADTTSGYPASLKNLVRSMLIYGAKAQVQFENYNSSNPASTAELTELTDNEIAGLATYDAALDVNHTLEAAFGLHFCGSALALESTTSHKLYFSGTTVEALQNAGVTVRCGNQSLSFTEGTAEYPVCVVIPGMAARNVLKNYTVTFESADKSTTVKLKVNAGAYIKLVLNPDYTYGQLGLTSDEQRSTLKNTVTALYWYSTAAEAYFGS